MSVNACVVDGVRYVVQSRDEISQLKTAAFVRLALTGKCLMVSFKKSSSLNICRSKLRCSELSGSTPQKMVRSRKLTFRNGMHKSSASVVRDGLHGLFTSTWRGRGGEDPLTSTSYIIRLRGYASSTESTYNLKPHMRSGANGPRSKDTFEAQLENSYITNKATLKRVHWIRDPETGAYEVWIGKMTSATQEEPSEIDTFYRLHTVNGVFQDPEALRMIGWGARSGDGVSTPMQINAMVEAEASRPIPGWVRLMPGYGSALGKGKGDSNGNIKEYNVYSHYY
ncbi:hypothetical protein Tco_1285167 [Tanacetum coccineum]